MKLTQLLSCYLPTRLRRWFIYLPLDAVLLLALLTLGILIRATFISAAPLYTTEQVPAEVEQQLQWFDEVIQRSVDAEQLDIYTGYSTFCGKSIEWDYGFYVFYALSLDELAKQFPERRPYVAKQIDHCTRLMLHLPSSATDSEIIQQLGDPTRTYQASLAIGYRCLVLGIRKQWIGDTLYDNALRGMAEALATDLQLQLEQGHAIWTSDQSTQLHAIWRCDQTLETDHSALFQQWLSTMQTRFIEPGTGLLYSQVSFNPDQIDSPPRATSIAWSIIFLNDLYPEFTEQQYAGLKEHRMRRCASLSAAAEFPGFHPFMIGDLESGPIVLTISPAATGFGLSAHRLYGQQQDFQRCYRFFELFGMGQTDANGKRYWLGNGMGDAILLYSKIARPRRSE